MERVIALIWMISSLIWKYENLKIIWKLARDELKKICSQFLVEDRYNFNETAKFFRMHPNKTLSNKAVNGTQMNKSRITVNICTNADKLKPVVISKAKRHRSFGKVWDPEKMVFYKYNTKAWMPCAIFEINSISL